MRTCFCVLACDDCLASSPPPLLTSSLRVEGGKHSDVISRQLEDTEDATDDDDEVAPN